MTALVRQDGDDGKHYGTGDAQPRQRHWAESPAAQRNGRHLFDARNPPAVDVGNGKPRAGRRRALTSYRGEGTSLSRRMYSHLSRNAQPECLTLIHHPTLPVCAAIPRRRVR